MKTIRFMCFETNSSSAHTLVYKHKDSTKILPPDYFEYLIEDDGYIYITLGNYGREPDVLKNLQEKLSYIATGIIGWSRNNIEADRYSSYPFEEDDKDNFSPKEWAAWMSDTEVIENDEEWITVVKTVTDYLPLCMGVKIRPSRGYVDHQSSEFYKKILDCKGATLQEVLFSRDIYILVDNDEH